MKAPQYYAAAAAYWNFIPQISAEIFRGNFRTHNPSYFPPHLKYVAARPLGIYKLKFGTNLEENANKKCQMNQLIFHSYRKIKPWANFEFTSLSFVD